MRKLIVIFCLLLIGIIYAVEDFVLYDGVNLLSYEGGVVPLNLVSAEYLQAATNYVTSATNYVAQSNDNWIAMVATNAIVTNTLPTAVGRRGKSYHILSATNSTKKVVIEANGGETINGDPTFTIKKEESISIVSDGANWSVY